MDEGELINLIKMGIGGKDQFVRLLEENLDDRIPGSYPLKRLVKWVIKKYGEKELARVLSVPDLESYAATVNPLLQVLPVFSLAKRTLTKIMDELSKEQTKWRFKRNTKSQMQETLKEKILAGLVKPKDIERAYRAILTDSTGDNLYVRNDVVLGPLGFCKITTLPAIDEYTLESLIEPLIIPGLIETKEHQVLNALIDGLELDGKLRRKSKKSRFRVGALKQILICKSSWVMLNETINSLILGGAIECRPEFFYKQVDWIELESEEFASIVMTPHGVVILSDDDDEPPERLAKQILSDYPNEQDLRDDLQESQGPYNMKLIELCFRRGPDWIARNLFTLPRLRSIAREMGFRDLKNVDIDTLVKLFMLGLGYNPPPEPRWLRKILKETNENLMRLEKEKVNEAAYVSIVTTAFRRIERILSNLTRFYVSVIAHIHDFAEYREYVEETTRKSIFRFSVSDWLRVIRQLAKEIDDFDDEERSEIEQVVAKSGILPSSIMKSLESLNRRRRPFTHDKSEIPSQKKAVAVLKQTIETLVSMINLKQMPIMVRMVRETTDEYGISYVVMVDEEGREWTVFSEDYWKNVPYLMHSRTSPVAVKPILVPLSRSDY